MSAFLFFVLSLPLVSLPISRDQTRCQSQKTKKQQQQQQKPTTHKQTKTPTTFNIQYKIPVTKKEGGNVQSQTALLTFKKRSKKICFVFCFFKATTAACVYYLEALCNVVGEKHGGQRWGRLSIHVAIQVSTGKQRYTFIN